MLSPFSNEPLANFADSATRTAFQSALEGVRAQLGRDWPLLIGGKSVEASSTFTSVNPARHAEVIGRHSLAGPEHVATAVKAADAAFVSWSRVPALERASVIAKAGAILRRRKHELSSWMVLETGKPWAEADADTAEAIDFCDFYAREALRYGGEQPITPQPGELNQLRYLPLGVGAVIPPWNFPLAITCGMTAAAVVTGNTVVLKPSSDAPGIARALCAVFDEAGVPPGVVNLLTGGGGTMGDALVDHPRVRFISFTGSKGVGLRIVERASKVPPGQLWIKRVVAEMGGKDAIVVDETADLEAAAKAVVASAFGFSGQKCSACSRLIVVESVHRELLDRVVALTSALVVGDPSLPGTQVGPVINLKAFEKIREYVEVGRTEGQVVTGGESDGGIGWFMQPTVVDGIGPSARLSCEEIFGPVLAVTKASNFEQAIALANATEYGLTGAAWSRERSRLQFARENFHVGNLYLNRKCTGAMVGGHPFGGFNMSGTDSKAGGRDYLQLFVQAQSVAELL